MQKFSNIILLSLAMLLCGNSAFADDLHFTADEVDPIFANKTDEILYDCAIHHVCPKTLDHQDASLFLNDRDYKKYEKMDHAACRKLEAYVFKDAKGANAKELAKAKAFLRAGALSKPQDCAMWLSQIGK